ncbi:hypothetical protein B0H16DRAFT_1736814 [Mycena metata]|uniref:Uncharacterized protein n=1 Tax=Mycena metata TaxID=1033252 RepID=A0AAD7HMM2_9AGAR|nr:hypothetical protein B0H16DRAFT_1736814 [Mycena metata]
MSVLELYLRRIAMSESVLESFLPGIQGFFRRKPIDVDQLSSAQLKVHMDQITREAQLWTWIVSGEQSSPYYPEEAQENLKTWQLLKDEISSLYERALHRERREEWAQRWEAQAAQGESSKVKKD